MKLGVLAITPYPLFTHNTNPIFFPVAHTTKPFKAMSAAAPPLLWSLLFTGGLLARAAENLDPQPPAKIVLVLADDLGWGDVGFHNTSLVHTPTMDQLVRDGVELRRHYVHYYCTPSRASLQSGRLPVHLLLTLPGPCDRNGAIPREMTGLAERLKYAGYATHHVGKWDAGMVTPRHTPWGRGYDHSLAFFGHGHWAWTQKEWGGSTTNATAFPSDVISGAAITDLWDTDKPSQLNGSANAEYLFRDRIVNALGTEGRVFLQYDSKLPHYPLQVPPAYGTNVTGSIDNARVYRGMVSFLDDQLGAIVSATASAWNTTLIIFSSDNGGFVNPADGPCNTTTSGDGELGHGTACFNGQMGASNYPLRGGKNSLFEGGIRSVAFVSGGYLPPNRRGTKLNDMVHIADWYATLCGLVGASTDDDDAEPPLDSIDIWPAIVGLAPSARKSFLLDATCYLRGEWKYIIPTTTLGANALGGPDYPNSSSPLDPISTRSTKCGPNGCLFNVVQDPQETADQVQHHLQDGLLDALKTEMAALLPTIYTVDHSDDPDCLTAARELYGGYYGPWQNLSEWRVTQKRLLPSGMIVN